MKSSAKTAHTPTHPPKMNERAMLVDLSISRWHSRKKDKKITSETARRYGTDEKAGNYRKNLLHNVSAPTYEAVTAVVNKARDFHRANTLPWGEGDLRILPSSNYEFYADTMRQFKNEFDAAVRAFVPDFPNLVQAAKKSLNGMWSAADYPDQATLHSQHDFRFKPYPLPVSDDFRVNLTDDQVDTLKSQIDDNTRQTWKDAQTQVWQMFADVVGHALSILGEAGGRRTKTSRGGKKKIEHGAGPARVTQAFFDNLAEACERLPRLNLDGDPALDKLVAELRDHVASLDPDYIRKSKPGRKEAEEKVKDIQDRMAAFLPRS